MIEHARVPGGEAAEDRPLFVAHVLEEDGAHHRQESEREQERAEQREHDCVRHRREQPRRGAAECVDRQVARDDHRGRVEDGAPDVPGRGEQNLVEVDLLIGFAAYSQLAKDVLHHDHGGIDEDAKVDRAQREQIDRDVPRFQQDEGGGERERNGRGDDQPRAQAAQEQDEDQCHHQDAEQQIVLDSGGGQFNQVTAVVIRVNLHIAGKDVLVQISRHRLDAGEHRLGGVAGAQEDHAFDGIVVLHVAELAQPRRMANGHLAEVLDPDRNTLVIRDDNFADIGGVAEPAQSTHVIELTAQLVEAAARVHVVIAERVDHVLDRDLVGIEQRGVENHLVLPCSAAKTRVVGNAGNRLVMAEENPVLEDL